MAGDPLAFVAFTLLPLAVLAGGAVLSITYAVVLEDHRILLSTALFVLMAVHQGTEVVQFLGGLDPHRNLLGELMETAVNLLAVGAIGYVVWGLQTERQRRERLSAVQESVIDPDGKTGLTGPPDPGEGASPADSGGPDWIRTPIVGRLLGYVLTTLPLGNTAPLEAVLERAVQNAGITFPIATFRLGAIPSVTVFGDPTYLQEILETVLERLVVYNDSSDPVVTVAVETGTRSVTLVMEHNGSGLPEDVVAELTGTTGSAETDDLELVYVHAFLERWGGSVAVVDGQVRMTLPTPGSVAEAGG